MTSDSCEAASSEDDNFGTIVICRDVDGPHTGGPSCFCCPGTFSVDDDVGIAAFLARQTESH